MAIVLNANPGSYFSAHEDLIFVAYEATKATDPNTYVDYKYVCDVFINGTRQARLKAVPNPSNYRGIFNIGTIVRDYIEAVFAPTLGGIRADQLGSGEFYVDVQCKFGEEYNSVLYTNVLEDSTRRYYNHVNGRLDDGSLSILSGYADKPITNRPLQNYVGLSDTALFIPYWPTDADQITVQVKTYGSSGLIATNTANFTPSAADVCQLFNVAPAAINGTISNAITAAVDYYTVEFLTPNITGESVYRFDIVCEPKYEAVNVVFLNRLGGYESYAMRKVSKRKYQVEKKEFRQNRYSVSDAGAVVYQSSGVYREQIKTYASQWREQLLAYSDVLTDAEHEWLFELVASPEIYIQFGSYFVPARIKTTNYEPKLYDTDDLQPLEVTFDYSDVQNTQYR